MRWMSPFYKILQIFFKEEKKRTQMKRNMPQMFPGSCFLLLFFSSQSIRRQKSHGWKKSKFFLKWWKLQVHVFSGLAADPEPLSSLLHMSHRCNAPAVSSNPKGKRSCIEWLMLLEFLGTNLGTVFSSEKNNTSFFCHALVWLQIFRSPVELKAANSGDSNAIPLSCESRTLTTLVPMDDMPTFRNFSQKAKR